MCNFVTMMVMSGINSSPVYIFNLKEFCISWLTWFSIKNLHFSEAGSFWSAPWQYPAPLKVSDYQAGLFCYLTAALGLLLSLSSCLPYPYVLLHLFVSPGNGLDEPYTHVHVGKKPKPTNQNHPPTHPINQKNPQTPKPKPQPPAQKHQGFFNYCF